MQDDENILLRVPNSAVLRERVPTTCCYCCYNIIILYRYIPASTYLSLARVL